MEGVGSLGDMFGVGVGVMMAVMAVLTLLTLFLCYTIQALAVKNKLSEFASFLAWIPVLQIYPIIRCGGGDFTKFLIGAAGMVVCAIGLGVLAGILQSGLGTIIAGLGCGCMVVGILFYMGRIMWRTATRRGVSGWVGLVCMLPLPIVNHVAYAYIAFHDGWVAPNKAGLALGTLLFVGPMVSQIMLMNSMTDRMQQMMQAGETGDMKDLAELMGTPEAASQFAQVLEDAEGESETASALAPAEPLDPGEPQPLETGTQNIEPAPAQLAVADPAPETDTSAEAEPRMPEPDAQSEGARVPNSSQEARPASPEIPAPPITSGAPYDEALGFAVPSDPPCPPGTTLRGAAPPAAFKRWCARVGPREDIRHGWYTEWHEDGGRALAGEYRDGLRVGIWTRWFPNGVKRVQAEFREGRQDGIMLAWNEQGKKVVERRFSEGSPASR